MDNSQIYQLSVGIDIGTTFSAVSFSYDRDPGPESNVHCIKVWPTSGGTDGRQVKVPTRIHYDKDGLSTFGYQTPNGAVEWFKLLLLDKEDWPEYLKDNPSRKLDETEEKLEDLGKSVVDVTADYLRQLWKYARETIADRFVLLDGGYELSVRFTVPAIWPGYARQTMVTAATQAGIFDSAPGCSHIGDVTVDFISEPQAAAIALMKSNAFRNHQLHSGEVVIFVDGGGGTIDVISYYIKSVSQTHIDLEECVPGDGALAGGIDIDRVFREYADKKFTIEHGLCFWKHITSDDIEDALDIHWENRIKRAQSWANYQLKVQIAGKEIRFDEDEIKACFQVVLDRYYELVDKQIVEIRNTKQREPKLIISVGGLGNSRYISRSLRERYQHLHRCKVLSGDEDDLWSAVCRGACVSKVLDLSSARDHRATQPIRILSKISRKCYGWIFEDQYDPLSCASSGNLMKTAMSKTRGHRVVVNKMEWPIKRGQALVGGSFKREYNKYYDMEDAGVDTIAVKLYVSDTNDPPTYYHRHHSDIRDTGYTIVINPPIPIEELPETTNAAGDRKRVFEWDTDFRIDGESLVLEAFSSHGENKGQKVGELVIDGELDIAGELVNEA